MPPEQLWVEDKKERCHSELKLTRAELLLRFGNLNACQKFLQGSDIINGPYPVTL